MRLDVTDQKSWADTVKAGIDAFGAITVLVNNAGVAGATVKTLDIDDFEYIKTINIDQHGVFNGMRAVVRR